MEFNAKPGKVFCHLSHAPAEVTNDHMDEIRSNTDFKNDMEKVRAAVQA